MATISQSSEDDLHAQAMAGARYLYNARNQQADGVGDTGEWRRGRENARKNEFGNKRPGLGSWCCSGKERWTPNQTHLTIALQPRNFSENARVRDHSVYKWQ
jgi:hypothetical protein